MADMTDGNDINSVSGVLKLYLRELREPIFSVQYFDQFMELASKLTRVIMIKTLHCFNWRLTGGLCLGLTEEYSV